jgi:hypothetical protein
LTDWNPSRWATPDGVERARALLAEVALCVPIYDEPARQTARDLDTLGKLGALQERLSGMSNIGSARNALTARFLAGPRLWSLWIDGDVFAPEGTATWLEFVAHALERVTQAATRFPPPIFAGAYPCKQDGDGTLACVFRDPASVVLGQGGGYHLADWIGGGAVLAHRATIKRLAEHLGIPGPGRVRYLWERVHYFGPWLWRNGLRRTDDPDPELEGELALEEHGEDVGLSATAGAAGVAIEVDTRLRLDHRGEHAFTWEQALGPPRQRSASVRISAQRLAVEAERALDPGRIVLPSPAERRALLGRT